MSRRLLFSLFPLLMAFAIPATAATPSADEYLSAGKLAEGEEVFAQHVEEDPDDQQARFGLGTIRFLQGIERLGQFLYKHGATNMDAARQLPLFRAGILKNPDPAPTTYADYRKMLEQLLADLAETEKTLAKIDGKVKLPIRFGRIRLDIDGNGQATEEEALWRIYAGLNRRFDQPEDLDEQAQDFRIAFDTGDAFWLRGYCHLLSAMIEVQLAYDGQEWFDHCGHLLFPKAESPYKFLIDEPDGDDEDQRDFWFQIVDAIAAIHLADFPLKEPQRMTAARKHLLAMTDLSRKSWDAILAETDNDDEWIPNAQQQSVVGIPVTAEMIATWQEVLAEFDALLNGKKLIPFWRDTSRGINLKRVFTEPRDFDLVLWIQGTAAVPYLEEGEPISPETWDQAQDIFRGNFIGFAIWFN